MTEHLQEIIAYKRLEVQSLRGELFGAVEIHDANRGRLHMAQSLRKAEFSVIAEVKRKSPSAGVFCEEVNLYERVSQYQLGGARAVSVLTDRRFFGGSREDLAKVAQRFPALPVLMKDFVVDEVQLAQAAALGASTVLLIVAVLGRCTAQFVQAARNLGLECLVEVHDVHEIETAVAAGAEMIGVNNRSLYTFETDLSIAERMSRLLPASVVKVAESGIKTPEDARRMAEAGYDAVLVGESLMRSTQPGRLIGEMLMAATQTRCKKRAV